MRRILIIDDEDDIREVAALSYGTVCAMGVIKAHDAAEGMEQATMDQPDAILLDMKMPNIDGRGTLELLKVKRTNCAHPCTTSYCPGSHFTTEATGGTPRGGSAYQAFRSKDAGGRYLVAAWLEPSHADTALHSRACPLGGCLEFFTLPRGSCRARNRRRVSKPGYPPQGAPTGRPVVQPANTSQ